MRRLRLSLVGVVILALLGGLSIGTVAQEDAAEALPVGAAPVSGQIREVKQFQVATAIEGEDRDLRRGAGYLDRVEMDDARLSGAMWQVWNQALLRPRRLGEVLSGTTSIINDHGSWVGTMRGYLNPATKHYHMQIELTGTDAYEGLSALLYAKGPSTWDVEGFIFPGAFPEYPDPVEVPAL